MVYPRIQKVTGSDKLVSENQMVGYHEHLAQEHRLLFLTGELGEKLDFNTHLLALDSLSHKPIKLVITSGGGLLDTALILYDTLKLLHSPVYTLGRWCCSAAVLILAVGKKRYLLPHSKVMLHLPFAQLAGDVHLLEIQHRQMQKYREVVVDILLDCGVTRNREQILNDIDREFWLDPVEAIEYGLADAVMAPSDMARWLRS